MSVTLISESPDETMEIGRKIASFLKKGSIVALNGALGSGKTCLVKGIAAGFGINEIITSPTFTIINEYQIPGISFYHIDAYRLNNEKEYDEIAGSEFFNQDGIYVIEWSEKIQKSFPDDIITVNFEIKETQTRIINIIGPDSI